MRETHDKLFRVSCVVSDRGVGRTCFLSTMLAGLTFSTVAPSDISARSFSAATSSGIIIASQNQVMNHIENNNRFCLLVSYPLVPAVGNKRKKGC